MFDPVRTATGDRDVTEHPALRINWIAHLSLVLAALNLAFTLGARGFGEQVRQAGVVLLVVNLVAIVTHAVLTRRARRPWTGVAPFAACAAGAAAMVLAQTSRSDSVAIAFAAAAIASFLGGIVGIATGLRKQPKGSHP